MNFWIVAYHFLMGVAVVNLLLYLSVPGCLLSFFQGNTSVLNLSEKPHEMIQVPHVVNCSPFFSLWNTTLVVSDR